ncbi:hypothetical protein NSTC745_05005 [Nostoc sp. DSM 114161]|jgi:magnesium-transporting ATPase (P-type)|uniref:cation-transporting P-type ATPase n=1 Tax=Nostoc sp. DSM 114161 TaxID=3440143 RepID=UPI00404568BE
MNSHHAIWSLTPEEVYNNLTTTPQGLSEVEANLRIKQYGYNELPEPQTRLLILRFIDQLTHFMALLLWVVSQAKKEEVGNGKSFYLTVEPCFNVSSTELKKGRR